MYEARLNFSKRAAAIQVCRLQMRTNDRIHT
jgi:hypothetical protein